MRLSWTGAVCLQRVSRRAPAQRGHYPRQLVGRQVVGGGKVEARGQLLGDSEGRKPGERLRQSCVRGAHAAVQLRSLRGGLSLLRVLGRLRGLGRHREESARKLFSKLCTLSTESRFDRLWQKQSGIWEEQESDYPNVFEEKKTFSRMALALLKSPRVHFFLKTHVPSHPMHARTRQSHGASSNTCPARL